MAETSLAELDLQARHLVDRVRSTKQPLVITEDGAGVAVLVDAENYQRERTRLALLEKIALGEADIAAGRLHSQEEAEAILDGLLEPGA